MERFQKIQKLGDGQSGVVYKARNLIDMQLVAFKRIREEINTEGIPATTLREISVLRELKHPNIVRLQNIVLEEKCIYLIFECLSMNLQKLLNLYLYNYQSLDAILIKSYLYQITLAVSFCHQRRIFHRDLCPKNILVDKKGWLKLADFGNARYYYASDPKCPFTYDVVMLPYKAPELLLGTSQYSPAIDIWSIGCIFAEMVLRKPLFNESSEVEQLHRIFKTLGTPTPTEWPEMINFPFYVTNFPKWKGNHLKGEHVNNTGVHLLKQMLKLNPANRISGKKIILHHYFHLYVYNKHNLPVPKFY